MRRLRSAPAALLAAAVAVATAGMAGCGDDDFANEPPPPSPIELTAKVDDEKVVLSPTRIGGEPIGAGLVNITVSNLRSEPVQIELDGPTATTSNPIVGGGVLELKIDLDPGEYTISAADSAVEPFEFTVGPERESSGDELLLP